MRAGSAGNPRCHRTPITPDRSVAGAAGEGGSGLGRVVAFTQKRLSKPNARRTIELERMFGKVFSEYDETNSIVVPLDMPFGHLRYVSEFKHSARHCKPPCHYRRRSVVTLGEACRTGRRVLAALPAAASPVRPKRSIGHARTEAAPAAVLQRQAEPIGAGARCHHRRRNHPRPRTAPAPAV
jgi:hypothetical protein